MSRIFGPKRDKIISGRELHNEKHHNVCSSSNIIRIIKSKRMRWAEHVARMMKKMNAYRVLIGKSEKTNH
jgi:hypothetical protein